MKRVTLYIATVFIFLLPVYFRTLIEAKHSLEAADLQLENGKVNSAIELYRTAIQWNSVYNSYSLKAAEKLYLLSKSSNFEEPTKIVILNELIRGIETSRRLEIGQKRFTNLVEQAREDLIAFNHSFTPFSDAPTIHNGFKFASFVFFSLWLATTVAGIFNCVAKDGHLIVSGLRIWLPLSIISYLLWLTMLNLA